MIGTYVYHKHYGKALLIKELWLNRAEIMLTSGQIIKCSRTLLTPLEVKPQNIKRGRPAGRKDTKPRAKKEVSAKPNKAKVVRRRWFTGKKYHTFFHLHDESATAFEKFIAAGRPKGDNDILYRELYRIIRNGDINKVGSRLAFTKQYNLPGTTVHSMLGYLVKSHVIVKS